MSWRRLLPVGIGILGLLPAVAEAHGLTGTSSWTDELICIVPAVVLLAAVFLLGRDDKSTSKRKGPRQ